MKPIQDAIFNSQCTMNSKAEDTDEIVEFVPVHVTVIL